MMAVSGDIRPIPDPTELTTQQLHREIAALRTLAWQRMDGIETAKALEFRHIQSQFADRETNMVNSLTAAQRALEARAECDSRATAKSEAATTKTIESQSTMINTIAKGLGDKIDDIKLRVTTIEGRGAGTAERQKDTREDLWALSAARANIIAIGSAIISGLAVVLTVVAWVAMHVH